MGAFAGEGPVRDAQGGAMGVLAQWASRMREASQRDESLPLMASASGLTILMLGFALHGFLVAQKGDLVPLFERPLADGERGRVARVLEDEAAAYIVAAGNVLVARDQKDRLLARLAQSDIAPDRDALLGLFLADPGRHAHAGGEPGTGFGSGTRATARPASPMRSATGGAGAAVPLEPDGENGSGWTIYNITCDDPDGADGLGRRSEGSGSFPGR